MRNESGVENFAPKNSAIIQEPMIKAEFVPFVSPNLTLGKADFLEFASVLKACSVLLRYYGITTCGLRPNL